VLCRALCPKGEFVFVKTSSRSPKDASILSAQLTTDYAARLKAHASSRPISALDDNTRLIALLEAATAQLRIATGARAVELLIHSERIYQDMQAALSHVPPSSKSFVDADMNVVVRAWVPIDIDLEFRAFVRAGRVTAMTQYNHHAHFPDLVRQKDVIGRMIQNAFDRDIGPKLAKANRKFADRSVVDFAITRDASGKLDKVLIIEIKSVARCERTHDTAPLCTRSTLCPPSTVRAAADPPPCAPCGVLCCPLQSVSADDQRRSVQLGARRRSVGRPCTGPHTG
jgi:hypothetical protein